MAIEYLKGRSNKVQKSLDEKFGILVPQVEYNPWRKAKSGSVGNTLKKTATSATCGARAVNNGDTRSAGLKGKPRCTSINAERKRAKNAIAAARN